MAWAVLHLEPGLLNFRGSDFFYWKSVKQNARAQASPVFAEREKVLAEKESAMAAAAAEQERVIADAAAQQERVMDEAKAERENMAAEKERMIADAAAQPERVMAEAAAEREKMAAEEKRAAAEAKAQREHAMAEIAAEWAELAAEKKRVVAEKMLSDKRRAVAEAVAAKEESSAALELERAAAAAEVRSLSRMTLSETVQLPIAEREANLAQHADMADVIIRQVGDRVKCRVEGGRWVPGVVIAVDPMEVLCDGWDESLTWWDEVVSDPGWVAPMLSGQTIGTGAAINSDYRALRGTDADEESFEFDDIIKCEDCQDSVMACGGLAFCGTVSSVVAIVSAVVSALIFCIYYFALGAVDSENLPTGLDKFLYWALQVVAACLAIVAFCVCPFALCCCVVAHARHVERCCDVLGSKSFTRDEDVNCIGEGILCQGSRARHRPAFRRLCRRRCGLLHCCSAIPCAVNIVLGVIAALLIYLVGFVYYHNFDVYWNYHPYGNSTLRGFLMSLGMFLAIAVVATSFCTGRYCIGYHCSESSESKFETIYLWRGGKDGGRGQGDCPGIFWCVCVVFFVCVWCFLCVDVCVPGCSMFLMNGR